MPPYSKKMSLCFFYFFIICCCLFMSGCSALVYERKFRMETDSNQWVKVTDTTYPQYAQERAQYKNNIVTLSTQYYNWGDSCPISMGPPIVPIIPLFFFCFGGDSALNLGVTIENLSDELSIDIQGIRLFASGDRVVPIYRAHYCPAGEGYNSRDCSFSEQDGKIVSSFKIISTSPLILNKGRFFLSFSYLKTGRPDELTLEFGKIFSKGEQINLPPLKLRSSNGVAYIPLMLSGHEPVFR